MKCSNFLAGLVWVSAGFALQGCGGGGGGKGPGDLFTESGGDIQRSVHFTEDTSLDDDITGLWILTAELDFTQTAGARDYRYAGVRRDTFYVVREAGELVIRTCLAPASDIVETDSALEFIYDNVRYLLEKQSNTRLSGNVEFFAEEGEGQASMIKTAAGPTDLAELATDYTLGTFDYSIDGADAETFNVVCYSDEQATETWTEEDEVDVIDFELFELRDNLFNAVTMLRYTNDGWTDFSLEIGSDTIYIDADDIDDESFVSYSAEGTDVIAIEIDAMDDSTGETFSGSGSLGL